VVVGKQLQDQIVFRQTAVDPASMHASQLPPLAPVDAFSLQLNIVTVSEQRLHAALLHASRTRSVVSTSHNLSCLSQSSVNT